MSEYNDKIEALKAKYADKNEFYDPRFKRVGEEIFNGGTREAPYSGVPTFADLPYHPVQFDAPDFKNLQVAVVGIPMDLGVSNRPGSRFGPRAIRTIERIGPYHYIHDVAPGFDLNIADIGDVPLSSRYRLEQSHQDIEKAITKIVDAGVIPISIGGDHSITHPILKAVGKNKPVGLIHIDAHCDTGGPFDDTKFHHGGPFRNAVLDGVLDPDRTIQIGIRGSSEYLWEFSYASGMTVIHADDISSLGIKSIISKAKEIVGDGPTYLSFDIDSLDPSFAPGTGTPEIGGFTTREALELLRGLKGVNLVGADVVEVAPQYDATTNTAQAGAQMLFEIISLLPFSPSISGNHR